MSRPVVDHAALAALLPEAKVGIVEKLEPIRAGLSGAGVYAVTAARGQFVLRVQEWERDPERFAQQLRVLSRAAQTGIAPAVVHVDEAARAVVSEHISGKPLAAVLANPAERATVLLAVVDALSKLHGLEASDVALGEPLTFARQAFEKARMRSGFPSWALGLEPSFDAIADLLAKDPRRVVSHNDVNPGNVLWDGARVWLVDWEVTGLNHPYYDLAALALFLRLDDDAAIGLCARHDGAPLDDQARATFRALRKLVALLCGLTFLGLVSDLGVREAPTLADAPTLSDVYAAMRGGQLDMQTAHGQASMGLALLALGCA